MCVGTVCFIEILHCGKCAFCFMFCGVFVFFRGISDLFSIINDFVLNWREQSVFFPLAYMYVLIQRGKHVCVGRVSKQLNVT